MKQEVLEMALEEFWTKISEQHPEREGGNFDPGAEYDFRKWAQHAYEVWLEMNKPTYYVQRTMIQVLKVTGVDTPEEAEEFARNTEDAEWCDRSVDTERDFVVLDGAGNVCGS